MFSLLFYFVIIINQFAGVDY